MSDNGSPPGARTLDFGLLSVLLALFVVLILADGAVRIVGLTLVVVALIVLVARMLRGGPRA